MISLGQMDRFGLRILKKYSRPLARLALFIVFFWFGALKSAMVSPANSLVADLLEKTLPFITFSKFIIAFGVYEMIIGILFLIPRAERTALALLIPHMIMAFLPLVLLPTVAWQSFLVPTMEGQYIIKNLVIIALAFSVAARLQPLDSSR